MADLDKLTIGLVIDMLTERSNDGYDDDNEEVRMANQSDMSNF